MSAEPIPVVVIGAAGRMGREVVRTVLGQKDLRLVGAVDVQSLEEDAGVLAGMTACGLPVKSRLDETLSAARPAVAVDFTAPDSVMTNIRVCLAAWVSPVVGTTGLKESDLTSIRKWCEESRTPAFVAPNFAIGAVLMMQFAERAARFFDTAEIIELHHEKKVDAPSGTAMRTAQMMSLARGKPFEGPEDSKMKASLPNARGGLYDGLRVHSVRLPGLVAHQEVLFGGLGETLTIRHDSISRESFMPGVLLAIRKVRTLTGLTVGLEHLL